MQRAVEPKTDNQRTRLNNLYRFQRHFYNLTRATFLFGRDAMLRQMNARAGETILEVGCGTGRNLVALASLQPNAKLYGLDAADEMLKTAGAKLDALNLEKSVVLRQALAEEFDYQRTFRLGEPFDKIFISYSLSMFPFWEAAVYNALDNLKPGGSLYIIDFWDGRGLPRWLIKLRTWWLGLFHVSYRPEFLRLLEKLERDGAGRLTVAPVARRYAFIAHFQKK